MAPASEARGDSGWWLVRDRGGGWLVGSCYDSCAATGNRAVVVWLLCVERNRKEWRIHDL
ncbi:hypothetical protein HanHA300_Chr10g0355451 [Helianthus annuus]|nr:hypothetical protein HanHA300_Chr10g0355451 [Helianthus annuus]KAJ0529368.1 hypothetical protein HanHA89_Chr10g0377041 [Helianthus annuus]KAJ0696255.1 hypothetical protein HanLR1_Chr10g0354951 [Helianthus annuus]